MCKFYYRIILCEYEECGNQINIMWMPYNDTCGNQRTDAHNVGGHWSDPNLCPNREEKQIGEMRDGLCRKCRELELLEEKYTTVD